MTLDINKYYPKETYSRNSVDCVICKIRQKLIKRTPEEIIRQAFIEYLIIEKSIPKEQIEIEIPLSRIKKGDRKRADIIIYGDNEKKHIVLVVECKKNDLSIIDRNIDQVKYYNTVFNANCIVVTNGNAFVTYKKFNEDYKELSIIPSFKELRNNHSLKKHVIVHEPYERHSYEKLFSTTTHDYLSSYFHLGVDTPKKYYPFLSNLVDFIFDKETLLEKLEFNGIKIIRDLGIKYDSFGNAAGGSWVGEYKKLLVEDKSGNHLTIGIAIMGGDKYENHPRYGTTKGYTYLVVSIDDFEKSHNSLQLNIDKHLLQVNNNFTINHDGKLSSGHNGSLPYATVKSYIKKMAPHLINNDKIQLANLSNESLITHNDINAIQFIQNLIEYAILRDALRRGER